MNTETIDYENELFTLSHTDKQAFTDGYSDGFCAELDNPPSFGREAYNAGYTAGSRDRKLED